MRTLLINLLLNYLLNFLQINSNLIFLFLKQIFFAKILFLRLQLLIILIMQLSL